MDIPKEQFPLLHRLLHWAMALLMLLLFVTGFLRMEWMSKKAVVSAIEQNTQGVELSKQQKLGAARTLMHPMWEWHERAAYVFVLLLLIRLVYVAIKGKRFPCPWTRGCTAQQRIQGALYLLFYFFVLVNALTGFYLMWVDGDLKGQFEKIHKLAIFWFPAFFLLHLLGVIKAETTDKKGLVSQMIAGDQNS